MRTNLGTFLTFALALAYAAAPARAGEEKTYPLYPDGAPGALGKETGDEYHSGDVPTVTVFRPEAGKARVLAFNSLKEGKVLNPVQWNSAMDDYFKQQVALAVKGDISGKEALQKAQDKANQLLKQQK